MTDAELVGLRAFLRAAAALKDQPRSGLTPGGAPESVAAHSWRVGLVALALAPEGLDLGRVLALCVVHDLGEALSGDTPAPAQVDAEAKTARERADLAALLGPAPAPQRAAIAALWEEYEAGETPEARFVKAVDKLETVMSHVEGPQPPGFDVGWNLGYGRRWTDAQPAVAALRRLVDAETARAAAEAATREA